MEEENRMTEEDKREIIEAVKEAAYTAVDERVNGKVDALRKSNEELSEKLDYHMEEIEPFLAGWRGGKLIGNTIKWVAGLVIAVAGAIAVITQIK